MGMAIKRMSKSSQRPTPIAKNKLCEMRDGGSGGSRAVSQATPLPAASLSEWRNMQQEMCRHAGMEVERSSGRQRGREAGGACAVTRDHVRGTVDTVAKGKEKEGEDAKEDKDEDAVANAAHAQEWSEHGGGGVASALNPCRRIACASSAAAAGAQCNG